MRTPRCRLRCWCRRWNSTAASTWASRWPSSNTWTRPIPSRRCCRATPLGRARVRALAQLVACEIHPLNNLRVLKYLVRELKVEEEAKNDWYRHWVRAGLEAFERQLAQLPASTYLLWRHADPGRLLPGAADLQWQARQYEFRRPDAHHGGVRCLHGASGFPEGAAFELPGQRELNETARRLDHARLAGTATRPRRLHDARRWHIARAL